MKDVVMESIHRMQSIAFGHFLAMRPGMRQEEDEASEVSKVQNGSIVR